MSTLRTTATALLLAAAIAGVAGCSDSSDDRTSSAAVERAIDRGSAESSAGDAALAREGSASTAQLAVDQDAKKIRTGTIEMRAPADEVAGAANRVASIAEAAGGAVDEQRSTGGRHPSSDLVLRVPPERFRDVMGQIEDVADVQSSTAETRDVTGEYADLDGRLTAMRISVERLRGFLAQATDVNQIASLESELTRREAELESLQGQLDALSAQVEMATIRVGLTTKTAPVVSSSEPPSPASALARGWEAFVAAVRYVAAGIAISLPFLAVAVVAVLVVRRLRPRRPQPVSG